MKTDAFDGFRPWLFPKQLGSLMMVVALCALSVNMVRSGCAVVTNKVARSTMVVTKRVVRPALEAPPVFLNKPDPPAVECVPDRPYFVVDASKDEAMLKPAPEAIDNAILIAPAILKTR